MSPGFKSRGKLVDARQLSFRLVMPMRRPAGPREPLSARAARIAATMAVHSNPAILKQWEGGI
jgi:hypothetical protein